MCIRDRHTDVLPETAEFLLRLREQTERLTQVTKTLLEMSNLQQVARNEQIQLIPMIEEIFTDLAPLADKRGVTLKAEVDGVLTGSDALIYRLLFNLTENAVKMCIRDRHSAHQQQQYAHEHVVELIDTLGGVPADHLGHLGDAVAQADHAGEIVVHGAADDVADGDGQALSLIHI